MDDDKWHQKCQKAAFIISCNFPELSFWFGLSQELQIVVLQIRKMEHLRFLASDYKERVGFVFLGRKRKMFWKLSLQAKIQNIYKTQEHKSLQITSRTDASSIKANN